MCVECDCHLLSEVRHYLLRAFTSEGMQMFTPICPSVYIYPLNNNPDED